MQPVETILIIDDDRALRLSLRAQLEALGLAVAEAADGTEGLVAVARIRPAMVLLDLTMPGLNGFEVCERIKAMPEGANTVVVVMSALLGTSQRMKAFHCGAVDCLAKPIQLEKLETRVRTHLAIRAQSAELLESRDTLARALRDADAMNRNLLNLNEKLSHSEDVKTRFLALMRNEINNPLNDIMGLAGRIGEVPYEKGLELAAMIKDEAHHLDCQIQNVFTAAELEAGELSPCVSRVDVGSVARDVLGSFGSPARTKGMDLSLGMEGPLDAFLTDGEKLHHILANLVSNAIKYSEPRGKVSVLVAATPQELCVKVVDAGPGIPESERRAIFEPFHPDGGPRKFHQGQGLGLPVAKALVDILGGTLHVESGPGRGAAFQVTLPMAPDQLEIAADSLDGNILIFDEPQEF